MELQSEYRFQYRVQAKDLASELSISEQDQFPEVLATSRMIAFMELAAARQMQSLLEPKQLSVGVDVNIRHSSATLVDKDIYICSRYIGRDKRLYLFEVEAYDSAGSIGKGQHSRAVIETQRLINSAQQKS